MLPSVISVNSIDANFFNILAHHVLSKTKIPVLKVWWPTALLNGTDGAISPCIPLNVRHLPTEGLTCGYEAKGAHNVLKGGWDGLRSIDGTHYWGQGPALRHWNRLLHNLVQAESLPPRVTKDSDDDWSKLKSMWQFSGDYP